MVKRNYIIITPFTTIDEIRRLASEIEYPKLTREEIKEQLLRDYVMGEYYFL